MDGLSRSGELNGVGQGRLLSFARMRDFVLAVLALAGAVFWLSLLRRHWNVQLDFDDAYMFYRYAEHLRDGLGLSWNPDGVHTYGPTSLAWVAVTFLFSLLPFNSSQSLLLASWSTGVLAVFAMAWAVSRKTHKSFLPGVWRTAALVFCFVCVSYSFRANALNGMDTMLAILTNALVAGCALRWLERPTLAKASLLGAAGFAAFTARPDSALPFLMIVALGGLALLGQGGAAKASTVLAMYCGAVGAELLLCRWYFHTAIPFSFYVKSKHGYDGYTMYWYPGQSMLAFFRAVLPFIAITVVFVTRKTWKLTAVFLVPVLAASFYYTFRVLQIMGQPGRYYIPLLPFVAAPALVAMADAMENAVLRRHRELMLRIALLALIVVSASPLAFVVDRFLAQGRKAYVLPAARIAASKSLPETDWFRNQVTIADVIMRSLPAGASIAASEVGYLGSQLPWHRVVDVSGLNDPSSVRGEPMWQTVFDERPDVIWFPVNDYSYLYGSIYTNPALLRDYVVYDGAFNYGFAVRKDSIYKSELDKNLARAWAQFYPGYNMSDYVVQSVAWDRAQYTLENPMVHYTTPNRESLPHSPARW